MSEAAAPAPAAPAGAPSAPSTDSPPAPAAAKPTTPAESPAKPPASGGEKFMVKVNGRLREMTREEVIREAQKSTASRENFEKSAQLTRKNQALLKALADPDPDRQDEALRQLGVDPDRIAERRLAVRAQQAQMTPEQKRIAELEAEVERRESEAKTAAERAEQERLEAMGREVWEKTEQEYRAELDRAIKAGELGGMKPAEALYLMADAALMNLEYGIELPASELIAEAKTKATEARTELQQKLVSGLQGEALLDFLGADAVNAVVRAAVAKYKAGQPIQPLDKPAPIAEPPPAVEKPKWKRPSDIKMPWL